MTCDWRTSALTRVTKVADPAHLFPQQKTPRRGAGALLGLLQGGEICISIYVDPWEVGEPGDVEGVGLGRTEAICSTRGSTNKSCLAPSSVSSRESLTSVRTYVRFVCESDHRIPLHGGNLPFFLPVPAEISQSARLRGKENIAIEIEFRINGHFARPAVAFGP